MANVSAIDVAKGLQLKGDVAAAERLFRDLLASEPDCFDALEAMGVLLFQQGRFEQAVGFFGRAVTLAPQSARIHANLGEALRSAKKFDQAHTHLRAAATLDPTEVQTWNSLGLLALDLRRPSAALHAFREAIRLRPRFVHAHINLANTFVSLGHPVKAAESLREAIAIEPNNALALMNLGCLLSEARDPVLLAEAERVCRRAVALAPQMAIAASTLAKVLARQGRGTETATVRPTARVSSSSAAARPTAVRDEDSRRRAQAQHTKGLVLFSDLRLDEAENCLRDAITLDPDLAEAWCALAALEADRGDFERSTECARAAIAINPALAEAHWRVATNLQGRVGDEDVQAIEQALLDESISNDDRALLHFALAAVMNARRFYARAATELDLANLHQSAGKSARGLTYNPDQHSKFVDDVIACFTPEFIAQRPAWGTADPRPVFVVGHPRSGTTLTEQILASHPQVFGAGELNDVQSIWRSLHELLDEPWTDPFDVIHRLSADAAKKAAARYLGRLDALAPISAARVVDKMPDNINHLGLIDLLLPDARAIICQRDPRDIAVSCWQTGLQTCPWNNDWNHIAHRLADYQRLVKHWKANPPIATLELRYEELVVDLESHARRLIDFVGLKWDSACLQFHSNPRVVRTPSRVQVRQPIHSTSSGRWRLYEASLKPMFEAFERHGVLVEDHH